MARRPREVVLHPRRRGGERERDPDREGVHGPPEDPRSVPLVPRRHVRHDQPHRRPAPLGEREPADARGRARARPVPRDRTRHARTPRRRSRRSEETIELEGPETIAAFILETVTGTNGILIPPDGYLEGVRELCTEFGIVHDRRRGHVRVRSHRRVVRGEPLGRRARPDDDGEGAHLVVPAARSARRSSPRSPRIFEEHVFCGGLTYNSHPLSCAAALAAIHVHGGGRPRRATRSGWATVMARHHEELMAKHPSVGRVRNIGLFGIARAGEEPRHDGAAVALQRGERDDAAVNRALLDRGLFTMMRFNGRHDEPAAVHHRGAARTRGSRSSTRCSRSPTDAVYGVSGPQAPTRRPSLGPRRELRPSRRRGPGPRSVRPYSIRTGVEGVTLARHDARRPRARFSRSERSVSEMAARRSRISEHRVARPQSRAPTRSGAPSLAQQICGAAGSSRRRSRLRSPGFHLGLILGSALLEAFLNYP